MKKRFTIIELLCVIGIIVLLAGMLVPAVGSAIERSKKARAQSEISSLKTAISAFYAQYGYFPAGISNTTGRVSNEGSFIKCLCNVGNSSDVTGYNTRRITFLEWTGDELTDPWGGTYQVYVDSDRNGEISVSDETVYTDVAVYSHGESGSSAPESDWIKSWK